MRVLYFGEDTILSERIEGLVKKQGFLYSVLESYDEIYTSAFDVLILDEHMPCLFNAAFIKKICANGFIHSPVIVITEKENFEIKKLCFELGIRAYLKKTEVDFRRLARYLETFKKERANFEILKKMKIAVLDDSVFSLSLMRNFFSSHEIVQVDYYQDAAEFLKRKNEHKYQLFLIDLVMPEYDGEEIITHLRKKNPEAIILLITAYNNGSAISHCLSIGADDFILKPLEVKLFMARINSCINHYRLNKEILRNEERLFELASKDFLTKAYNRTYFFNIYKQKLAEIYRDKQALSFVLLDIDYFKNINDRYGHLKGDYVLKELVRILKKIIRENDLLCRWGGEEFVILLSNTSLKEAEALAKRMQLSIQQHTFEEIGSCVTASFGITQKKENDANDTIEAIFKRLDNSLYLAKLTGRNRVVCDESLQVDYEGVLRPIDWGAFFKSGYTDIDEEHHELVSKINEMINGLSAGAPKDRMLRLAAELIRKHVRHFRHEEYLLQKLHYKKYSEQKAFHKSFLQRLLRCYKSLQDQETITMADVQYFMEGTLVQHIVKNDFKFFFLLKNKK